MSEENLRKLQSEEIASDVSPAPTAKPGSMRRFRQNNRRIDYYPTAGAFDAIDTMHKANPNWSLRELVDYLVVTGYKSASGKQ
jgi:hypothetical protein